MKKILCVVMLSLAVPFAVACGDSTSDDSSDTTGGTTSGSQTCQSSHECINGSCECTNEGKKGNSCTDNDKCEAECKVCSS